MKRTLVLSILACFVLAVASVRADEPKKPELTMEQRAEKRTNRLAKQLKLTREQQKEVYALNLDQIQRRAEIQRQQRELHRDMMRKYKKILSQEQFEKLSEVAHPKKAARKGRKNR